MKHRQRIAYLETRTGGGGLSEGEWQVIAEDVAHDVMVFARKHVLLNRAGAPGAALARLDPIMAALLADPVVKLARRLGPMARAAARRELAAAEARRREAEPITYAPEPRGRAYERFGSGLGSRQRTALAELAALPDQHVMPKLAELGLHPSRSPGELW
jgi:hypothetical protein